MPRRRHGLAARREALGYTQEMLAHKLGVELSTVGRWERGALTPQPWRRPDLAKALKLSLEELDELLAQPEGSEPAREPARSTRREVMVDGALLAAAAAASHLVGGQAVDAPVAPTEQLPVAAALATASTLVAHVHRTYQAAHYGAAACLFPLVRGAIDTVLADTTAHDRRQALRLQCSLAVAEAKLATKTKDLATARAAAQQAHTAAEEADDPHGLAAAAYQLSCVHLGEGRHNDAEHLAVSVAERIRGYSPEQLTWRGALTLLSAIIAARRNDPIETARRLDHAEQLAQRLGVDGNIGWTAFGPTNVAIHRVSCAVALNAPDRALRAAEQIDLTALPERLRGRQAQFHLENARAHAQLGEDPQAVIHLLETERIASEFVRSNPNVHTVIRDLLARERRGRVPGLRGLATRAGVTP